MIICFILLLCSYLFICPAIPAWAFILGNKQTSQNSQVFCLYLGRQTDLDLTSHTFSCNIGGQCDLSASAFLHFAVLLRVWSAVRARGSTGRPVRVRSCPCVRGVLLSLSPVFHGHSGVVRVRAAPRVVSLVSSILLQHIIRRSSASWWLAVQSCSSLRNVEQFGSILTHLFQYPCCCFNSCTAVEWCAVFLQLPVVPVFPVW